MLTKLLPEQISKFWNIIKYAIEQSLPPIAGEHPNKMNRILAETLSGGLDVWASYEKNNETIVLNGIIVTKIAYDSATRTSELVMYCLYGYRDVAPTAWADGLKILAKYAKARGCNRVSAFTSIPYMVELAKKLGADTEYTYVSWGLDKIV